MIIIFFEKKNSISKTLTMSFVFNRKIKFKAMSLNQKIEYLLKKIYLKVQNSYRGITVANIMKISIQTILFIILNL
jgi:hypothetical protein